MEHLIKVACEINLGQLIAIGAMFFFAYMKFSKKFDIDQRFEKIEARLDKMDLRFERIEMKLIDLDKRLFVVETLMHMKECCVLKNDHKDIAQ